MKEETWKKRASTLCTDGAAGKFCSATLTKPFYAQFQNERLSKLCVHTNSFSRLNWERIKNVQSI